MWVATKRCVCRRDRFPVGALWVVGLAMAARAEIIAHEEALQSHERAGGRRGTDAGCCVADVNLSGKHKEFYYNGAGYHISLMSAECPHRPLSIVLYSLSDVTGSGDIYSTVSYPIIDAQPGRQHQWVQLQRPPIAATGFGDRL